MSHPIRRINALNRGNLAAPRQIESATSSALSRTGLIVHIDLYVQTRPDQVRPDAGPDRESVQRALEKSGGGYLIIDPGSASPVARLRPIPNTDRFELLYWSNLKGRWKTFGDLGRMKLMLESPHDIVENDPMLRFPRSR